METNETICPGVRARHRTLQIETEILSEADIESIAAYLNRNGFFHTTIVFDEFIGQGRPSEELLRQCIDPRLKAHSLKIDTADNHLIIPDLSTIIQELDICYKGDARPIEFNNISPNNFRNCENISLTRIDITQDQFAILAENRNLDKLELIDCEIQTRSQSTVESRMFGSDLSDVVFSDNLDVFHVERCRVHKLPQIPNVTSLICDGNMITSIPILPQLDRLWAKNNPLDNATISYYQQTMGDQFVFESEGEEDEMGFLFSESRRSDSSEGEEEAEFLFSDLRGSREAVAVPQTYQYTTESDFESQKQWIDEICNNNFDFVSQGEFDPKDQIVTIVSHSESQPGESLANCFALQSLLNTWFPTLHTNSSGQYFKWSQNQNPILDEPVFKIPTMEIYIDYTGYKFLIQFQSLILFKIKETQQIGSRTNGRLEYGGEKLYTLIPIDKKLLMEYLQNKIPLDFLPSLTEINLNRYDQSGIDPNRSIHNLTN